MCIEAPTCRRPRVDSLQRKRGNADAIQMNTLFHREGAVALVICCMCVNLDTRAEVIPVFDHIGWEGDFAEGSDLPVSLVFDDYWLFPAVRWTQCDSGQLAELRVIVSGNLTDP